MADPVAVAYLTCLRKSQLVETSRLAEVVAEFNAASLPHDVPNFSQFLIRRGLLTPWQHNFLVQGKHNGFLLGKYKLLSHLGTGGMSSVYLAEHTRMQRQVAIKVLPQHMVNDRTYLPRFHREAQAIAALDHPNIVQAYNVDNEGDIHFLVMQYIAGRNLEELVLKDGPLDYAKAADYIRQAAEGLHHAHERGIIHRDIKPSNLLLTEDGVIKILDLGLARLGSKEEKALTVEHRENVIGTTDYMAPEQAIDSHDVSARADQYSLGCTLYFLLTGHAPFPDGTLAQRLMKHQAQEPTPIAADRPDVPAELVQICRRLMQKSPAQRFASMQEAALHLAQWLSLPVLHGANGNRPLMVAQRTYDMIPCAAASTSDLPTANLVVPWSPVVAPVRSEGFTLDVEPQGLVTNTRVVDYSYTHAGSGFQPWMMWAIGGGAAVVAVLMCVLILSSGSQPAGLAASETSTVAKLIIDWPLDQRTGGELLLDGKRLTMPAGQSSLEISGPELQRRVVMTRPGFEPFQRLVQLAPGKSRIIVPWWQPLGTAPQAAPSATPALPISDRLQATTANGKKVTFFLNQTAWRAECDELETLSTTAEVTALADEGGAVASNSQALLGSKLSWKAENTKLLRSVRLRALESGADLSLKGAHGGGWQWNLGEDQQHENDDWEFAILTGPEVTALGFMLVHNNNTVGEKLGVFNSTGQLVAVMPANMIPMGSGKEFIGIISEEPIAWIRFDEDDGADDIGVADFQMGTRLPVVPVQSAEVPASARPKKSLHLLQVQQGLHGYTGTVDTHVYSARPDQAMNRGQAVLVDGDNNNLQAGSQGLLRFEGLFGISPDQIPPGASIVRATLRLTTKNPGGQIKAYRVLREWKDTDTWNDWALAGRGSGGIQPDGVKAHTEAEVSFYSKPAGPHELDVTACLQAWATGTVNHGWVFLPQSSDGWDFVSSEGSDPTERPLLTIIFNPAP